MYLVRLTSHHHNCTSNTLQPLTLSYKFTGKSLLYFSILIVEISVINIYEFLLNKHYNLGNLQFKKKNMLKNLTHKIFFCKSFDFYLGF